MSIEPFGGGSRNRRASWREIQQIKKNMKRIPIIQSISDKYHAAENYDIEEDLQHLDQDHNIEETQMQKSQEEGDKLPWWKLLYQLMKNRI